MNDKNHKQEQMTLELLGAIEKDSGLSQRHLASELGVALGMANSYLKRCIKKGFIKINQAPANRYLYYLTPKGFSEKSRLTAQYLSYSFLFYRKAGESCLRAYEKCIRNGWNDVVLCGISDLAEISVIRATETDINIVGIYDQNATNEKYINLPVFHSIDEISECDAYFLTDYVEPQEMYQHMLESVDKKKIIVPDVISIDTGN